MILPHPAPTDAEIKSLPWFIFTDCAPWLTTLIHDDDHKRSLLDQDMTVSDNRGGIKSFHIINMADCPTRYVIHWSDDSTIDSEDLTVFTDSYTFHISPMDFQHAYYAQLDPLPFVETVISLSSLLYPVDPVAVSILALYTHSLLEYRPAARVSCPFPGFRSDPCIL
jgi:hypothetical protein